MLLFGFVGHTGVDYHFQFEYSENNLYLQIIRALYNLNYIRPVHFA